MAGYKREQAMPLSNLTPKQVSAFSDAMRSRLHDRGSNFGKEYLRLFVNRIKLTGHQVEINGSYGELAPREPAAVSCSIGCPPDRVAGMTAACSLYLLRERVAWVVGLQDNFTVGLSCLSWNRGKRS